MGTVFFIKILQYLETMPVLGAFTVDDPLVQQQNKVTKILRKAALFAPKIILRGLSLTASKQATTMYIAVVKSFACGSEGRKIKAPHCQLP